jgi:hypothetical protein
MGNGRTPGLSSAVPRANMRTWIMAATLIVMGSPAAAQSYNHDMYESGPGGLPPLMYSTPYSPYNQTAPGYVAPPAYAPPPPSAYDLPTRGMIPNPARDQERTFRDLGDGRGGSYRSPLPEPPPAYDDDEDR